jgi:hypothetical protein
VGKRDRGPQEDDVLDRALGRPGARITLVDEDTGTVLTTWPDEA